VSEENEEAKAQREHAESIARIQSEKEKFNARPFLYTVCRFFQIFITAIQVSGWVAMWFLFAS